MQRRQDAHVSCHGHVCVLSEPTSEVTSQACQTHCQKVLKWLVFILIWKCGPCCLLRCASLSCLWQLWEYWFWQTAARSSRLEGVSSKCDKRGKLLTPGGKVQGPADYQKPFWSWEDGEVSSDIGMDGQQRISLLLLTSAELLHCAFQMPHWLEGKDAPKNKGELTEDARERCFSLSGTWLNWASLIKRTGPRSPLMEYKWEPKVSKLKAKTL